MNLAREFLLPTESTWGEAVRVESLGERTKDYLGEAGDGYRVYYATPDREVKVLGNRSILVNLTTGTVRFQPRE